MLTRRVRAVRGPALLSPAARFCDRLRSPQLGRPPAVTAAYAVAVRSLIVLIAVLNEEVKTLPGR